MIKNCLGERHISEPPALTCGLHLSTAKASQVHVLRGKYFFLIYRHLLLRESGEHSESFSMKINIDTYIVFYM